MASVAPVTTFPDEPESWLDYLARFTQWTVGARCTAAQLVVVGQWDGHNGSLVPSDIIAGAAGASITVDVPKPAGAGAPSRHPLPQDSDQILMFLTEEGDQAWRPVNAPGAIVLAAASEDFDGQVAAAHWFSSLTEDPAGRADALVAGIRDTEPAVRRSAIRAIADEGLDSAVPAVQEAATDDASEPVTATVAAVALWIMGQSASAKEAFDAIIHRVGTEQFLALWQVQRSLGDESATLYGPDPNGWEAS